MRNSGRLIASKYMIRWEKRWKVRSSVTYQVRSVLSKWLGRKVITNSSELSSSLTHLSCFHTESTCSSILLHTVINAAKDKHVHASSTKRPSWCRSCQIGIAAYADSDIGDFV